MSFRDLFTKRNHLTLTWLALVTLIVLARSPMVQCPVGVLLLFLISLSVSLALWWLRSQSLVTGRLLPTIQAVCLNA
ncbi:hypothetical protein ACFOJE_02510 [Azotobacter bryophylli]|uniref:Uncharacterized protein n=1 Tax=Azotobacter bryophylli TaxID=1986537 RepID=A0ABV7ANU4_9GAMM